MDGNYQRIDLDKLIGEWVQTNIMNVATLNPISMHITDLLQTEVLKDDILNTSMDVYRTLVKEIRQRNNPVKTSLVIPLLSLSRKIKMKIPKGIDDVMNDLNVEPPSIYLESWEQPRSYVVIEEFRCPLSSSFVSTLPKNFYVHYREHRYSIGIWNNWEFDRGIYIEYFPNGST